MTRRHTILAVLLAGFLLAGRPATAGADEVRVAVAANFLATARILVAAFEHDSPHRIRLASGSTGLLYAQLRAGAPFDVFLAADAERPQLLEDAGLLVPGSRFTYARGRLALWWPGLPSSAADDPAAALRLWLDTDRGRLAIADPALAPYGAAAMQALAQLDPNRTWAPRLVRGSSVGQAFHYVASGSASAGVIALAQLRELRPGALAQARPLPEALHAPLAQQAGRLRDARAPGAADAFLAWLRSDRGLAIIADAGYGVPGATHGR